MRRNFFLLTCCCLALLSCTNSNIIEDVQNEIASEDETIIVGVNLSGDIETDETPLTRGETDSRDLIGIQVYRGSSYFCYGLFDNMNNVHVALKAGSTYKFVCTVIKNGKDICYEKVANNFNGYPFYLGQSGYGNWCDNTFSYYMSGPRSAYLSDGKIALKGNSTGYSYREADRFYGELSDYTPAVNGSVSIPLRRVSCGIKVKVVGVTDGTAKVKCYNDYNTFFDNSSISNSAESTGKMYCMYNIKDAWMYADQDYQEPIKLSVVWTRGNGIVQDLGTKQAYVKRNVMNIIKVKLSTNDTDVDVDVDPEEGGMDEEDEDLNG